MAKKTRKCNWCKKDDTKPEDMEFVLMGKKKPVKKFYHKGECWDEFQKDKAFKEKEAQEKLELVETIMRIYKVKELPRQVYPFIEGIRNGTPVMQGQQAGKRYKQGYSYSLIKATYDFVEDTLLYYHENKDDFDGFMNEFKYNNSLVLTLNFIFINNSNSILFNYFINTIIHIITPSILNI